MIIKYLLVLFIMDGDIWTPQLMRQYTDYNKCMAEAIAVQFDRTNQYNAACMPIYEEAPKTST